MNRLFIRIILPALVLVAGGALDQIGHISLLAKPFTVDEISRAVRRALHPES